VMIIPIHLTHCREHAILVAFRFDNFDSRNQIVDIGLCSDVFFDRKHSAPIDAFSHNLSGVDCGIAFSWQQILVPSGQSTTVSMILRSEHFASVAPVLEMTDIISLYRFIRVMICGFADNVRMRTSIFQFISFVINKDSSRINWINLSFCSGSSFDLTLSLCLHAIGAGLYTFRLCD
jgi:hypothetical protein